METDSNAPLIYSPSAVLHLFNNSLNVSPAKKLIQLKGVFQFGKGGNYSGYFYDTLRDESSDAQLTIIVPALIRNELQPNKTITVNGFITKRVVSNASRIDIQLTVTDLVEQTQNKYSDEELKRIEIQQAKAQQGFRDVHSYIKEKIVSEQPFRIAVIIGKTGIIDNDIKHQLRESIAFYDLSFHRISLSAETEIIQAMTQLDNENYDVIVISRGGGENLDIFNRTTIVEKATQLKSLFVTAIGHKDDVTLLQKVADKSFITPSEFGQFLNETYNHTVEEVQNSRAQLVDSVKKQLTANFQKEIDNLKQQLTATEQLKKQSTEDLEKVYQEKIKNYTEQQSEAQRLQGERQKVYEQQVAAYKTQVDTLEKKGVNWALIIIAVIAGLVLGYLLKGH
ncbi:MAG TPA: exodeoxyribonuclease VII large subunit [Mucilaginibacter sp.]|nr:exodeoxyribonuclease VII large subunit [Mucilaginibacter sp.]